MVNQAENILINPIFLSLIFLYSDDKYLSMSRFNSCNFLSLLQLKKLKGPKGVIDQVLIDLEFKNKNHQKETRLISVEDFLKIQYSKECFINVEINKIYSTESLTLQALSELKIQIPRTDDECLKTYKEFFKNTESIHLCHIITSPSFGKIINTSLSPSSIFFLEKICATSITEKNFCNYYKNSSYWNKILSKEKEESFHHLSGCFQRPQPSLGRNRQKSVIYF
jgi:hypothetical protein